MKILFKLLFAKSVMLRMLSSSSRPTFAGLSGAVCSAAHTLDFMIVFVEIKLQEVLFLRSCNMIGQY